MKRIIFLLVALFASSVLAQTPEPGPYGVLGPVVAPDGVHLVGQDMSTSINPTTVWSQATWPHMPWPGYCAYPPLVPADLAGAGHDRICTPWNAIPPFSISGGLTIDSPDPHSDRSIAKRRALLINATFGRTDGQIPSNYLPTTALRGDLGQTGTTSVFPPHNLARLTGSGPNGGAPPFYNYNPAHADFMQLDMRTAHPPVNQLSPPFAMPMWIMHAENNANNRIVGFQSGTNNGSCSWMFSNGLTLPTRSIFRNLCLIKDSMYGTTNFLGAPPVGCGKMESGRASIILTA